MQNPESNPVGALKELCDFLRITCDYSYDEEGPDHSRKVRGVITILGTRIQSEDWVTKRKDAQKYIAKKLVDMIPVIKIGDDVLPNKRMDGHVLFQYELPVLFRQKQYTFTSDWYRKKEDAKRDILSKIVEHSMKHGTLGGIANDLGAAGTPQLDDIEQRAIIMLHNWQKANLDTIKYAIGINTGKDKLEKERNVKFDGLLTIAFIHPSFTHSDSVKNAARKFLNDGMVNYERLEFLGDAVLGLVASKYLFKTHPEDSPGVLTVKRQQLVREDACCTYMKKLGLDKLIIHRDVLQTPSNKTIADVFEAIIGAMYTVYEENCLALIQKVISSNAYQL